MLRGALKSEVEKSISAESVLILDSLNYIKGFRYELFCLVRNCKTTLCVIFCDTAVEKAREYLQKDIKQTMEKEEDKEGPTAHMSEELFEDYHGRMERPNPSNRWDRPCFTLTP